MRFWMFTSKRGERIRIREETKKLLPLKNCFCRGAIYRVLEENHKQQRPGGMNPAPTTAKKVATMDFFISYRVFFSSPRGWAMALPLWVPWW